MHRFRRLMVALARTEGDAGLIRYAAVIAGLTGDREFRFVHVLPSSAGAVATHDRALAELRAAVQPQFAGVPGTVQVSYDVLHGPLLDCLLTHAAEEHVDLIFVGEEQEASGRRTLARRLAMKAPCSVWLVPHGSAAMLRRVLVPIDFSEPAADGLQVAASMARLSRTGECLALNVYFDEAVTTYDGHSEVLRGEEERAYRQFIAPINCHGVKVAPLFEEGVNVAHAIARVAESRDVDLIVIATRGRSRSAAILLGSVTEEMISETRVPLLAVKHFGARLGVLQALMDRRFWHQGGLHTG
jgi:nucleotide-binding universal stress UspA family protein